MSSIVLANRSSHFRPTPNPTGKNSRARDLQRIGHQGPRACSAAAVQPAVVAPVLHGGST